MFPAYFIFPSSIPTKANSKLWHGYVYNKERERQLRGLNLSGVFPATLSLRSYLHPMENSEIVLFRNKSASISPLSQCSSSLILHY